MSNDAPCAVELLPNVAEGIIVRCNNVVMSSDTPRAVTAISTVMIEAIEEVGYGFKNTRDCYKLATMAISNAVEKVKIGEVILTNNFIPTYSVPDNPKGRITENWQRENWGEFLDTIASKSTSADPSAIRRDIEKMDAVLSEIKPNIAVNENMLDYIKKIINVGLPVLIGVSTNRNTNGLGESAVRCGNKWINEGITSHFLVLVSYKERMGNISLQGIDNAFSDPPRVIFDVDPKTKEMLKPISLINNRIVNDINYVDDQQYRITQVKRWKGINPTNEKGVKNW